MASAMECPKSRAGEIVVCSRRSPSERYRIPEAVRQNGFDFHGSVDSVSRERHRLMEAGASGTGSCSASGAGGWTGCLVRDWHANKEQIAGH